MLQTNCEKSSEKEKVKRMAAEAEIIEDTIIEVRSEATNDKSGKATPLDRILIIAPESANPVALLTNDEVQWKSISENNSITTLEHFS